MMILKMIDQIWLASCIISTTSLSSDPSSTPWAYGQVPGYHYLILSWYLIGGLGAFGSFFLSAGQCTTDSSSYELSIAPWGHGFLQWFPCCIDPSGTPASLVWMKLYLWWCLHEATETNPIKAIIIFILFNLLLLLING